MNYPLIFIDGKNHCKDQLDESSEKYVHIRSEQLVGAAIGVWIKNVHLDYLSGVSFAKVKTGINAGVYTGGNKGAILVRLQVIISMVRGYHLQRIFSH